MSRKIDFDTKKTEREWQKSFDKFWLSATPKWFEWIGWFLILGALTFLSEKSSHTGTKALVSASYLFVLFYFQSYFYHFEFTHGRLAKRYPKLVRGLSICISGLLALGVYYILKYFISVLQASGLK